MPYADESQKMGRPFRGRGPTRTLSLRFTGAELETLRTRAMLLQVPMSTLMRRAMDDAGLFNAPSAADWNLRT